MLFLFLVACEQSVHIKSSVRLSKVVIDDRVIESVGPDGRDALVPINFGPASYSAFENDRVLTSGLLSRSQIQPWLFGLCVGGAMVFTPTLALTGALAANPSWIFAPAVILNGGGAGAFWAYLAQTASFWTLPAALLGALVGLLPLVGLIYSERLPDVVLVATPELMRP